MATTLTDLLRLSAGTGTVDLAAIETESTPGFASGRDAGRESLIGREQLLARLGADFCAPAQRGRLECKDPVR